MSYIVKTQRCLEWRLRRDIKRNRLTNVENIVRGIGKTELLVKIAKETGVTIVCRDKRDADIHRKNYPSTCFIAYSDVVSGRFVPNKYLLEEGIPLDKERLLHKNERVIGGYSGRGNGEYYISNGKLCRFGSINV